VTKKEDHQEEDPDIVSAIITQLQLPNLAKKKGKKERKRASGRSISLLGMKLNQHSLLEGTKLVVLISYLPPTLVNRLRLLEGGNNQILCRLKGTDLDKGGRKCRCRSDERGGRGEELRSQPCSGGEVESKLCRRRPEARPKAAPSKLPRKGPRHQQSAPPTWPRMGRTRRRGGRRTHRAWSERRPH